jgi:hypothetical protein
MRIAFTLVLLAPSLAIAQQVPPAVAVADSAYNRGDWGSAKRLYQAALSRDSTRGRAWLRLGLVSQELKDFTTAANAYRHAIALQVQLPVAVYQLAKLEAVDGQRDSALALLRRDVAIGAAPPGKTMLKEPEFVALHANAEFKRIVASADSASYPCRTSPKAHEFDFWIGQWDVTQFNQAPLPHGPGTGFNDVHPILEGCVLLENWAGSGGGTGKSFNWYDTNLGKWRQAWMGDGGGPLDYVGEYKDGAMRFEGWTLGPNGMHVLQKLTFYNIAHDTVRQQFEQSADSGKTWSTTFDGRYVRRRSAAKVPARF